MPTKGRQTIRPCHRRGRHFHRDELFPVWLSDRSAQYWVWCDRRRSCDTPRPSHSRWSNTDSSRTSAKLPPYRDAIVYDSSTYLEAARAFDNGRSRSDVGSCCSRTISYELASRPCRRNCPHGLQCRWPIPAHSLRPAHGGRLPPSDDNGIRSNPANAKMPDTVACCSVVDFH